MSVRHHKYINGKYIKYMMSNRQKICGCELAEQPSTNRQVWATINRLSILLI